MIAARCTLLALALSIGCRTDSDLEGPPPADVASEGSGTDTDDRPMISTAPPGPTDPTDAGDDSSSTGLPGLETGDDIFVEVGYGGGGKVVPGESLMQGWGEAFVLQYEDNAETVLCAMAWETTMTEVVTTCADCDFAFLVQNGAPEIETNENGACAEYGLDVDAIQGTTVGVGYRMNAVLQEFDGTWTAVGDAEFDTMTGDFYYEMADEA